MRVPRRPISNCAARTCAVGLTARRPTRCLVDVVAVLSPAAATATASVVTDAAAAAESSSSHMAADDIVTPYARMTDCVLGCRYATPCGVGLAKAVS